MEVPTIILAPFDGDWRMGDDMPVQCPLDITVVALMKKIEEIQGVPAHRQQIRLPSGKLVQKTREIWALRRHGIQNETIIRVEPTRPGAWLWHDIEYYVNKLLGEVVDILSAANGPVLLDDIHRGVKYPPCFPYTFRVFLRQHPDCVRFRSDITSGKIWIELTRGVQLPSFEHVPITLGGLPQYDPSVLDWEDFSDLDSMRPIESSVTLPDVDYDVAISGARGLASNGDLINTNPFVVVLLDGKYVGHSKVQCSSRGPLWRDARFRIGLPFGCSLGDYQLSFEVWNFEKAVPVPGQELEKNIILKRVQYVDMSKSGISDFLQPDGVDVFRDYSLVSCALEEFEREERKQAELAADAMVESGLSLLELDRSGDSEDKGGAAMDGPSQTPTQKPIADDKDSNDGSQAANAVERPVFTKENLLATASHGELTLMGSRSIFQLQVRAAFELYSHESEISDDIQPFVIVVWNGVDIGQTPFLKFTRWASWHDSIFNIPVPGSMEPGQCTLVIQVWNMDKIGGGKKLMSTLTLTSKALRDFLTKKSPFANREQFELTLPVKGDEEGRAQTAGKKKKGTEKKGKNSVVAGYVSLLGGLVGLQENSHKLYEIHFLVGGNMSREEVICVLMWNSVEIGRTDSAPSVTEKVSKKLTSVKWYWKKNKFIFSVPDTEDWSEAELKIDCFDPTTKGSGSFVGSLVLAGEEISALLDQDWAVLQQITLKKDPKRDDKQRISKGTINLRGGRFGSRLENERVVDVRGCYCLPVRKEESYAYFEPTHKPQFSCYCIVYWNHEVIGRTKPVPNDGNPVWELFDDRWCMATEVQSSPMFYGASELFIEVWEEDTISQKAEEAKEDEDEVTSTFLGSCRLFGQQLQELLESLRPLVLTLPLFNQRKPTAEELKTKTKKKKKNQVEEEPEQVQGYIVIGSPGTKDKTPLEDIDRTENLYNSMLNNEIERSGKEIFERTKK